MLIFYVPLCLWLLGIETYGLAVPLGSGQYFSSSGGSFEMHLQ